MAFDSTWKIAATAIIIALSAYALYSRLTAPPEVPSVFPWVGVKDGPFSVFRARIISMGNLSKMVEEGYRKVGGCQPSLE